MIRRIVAIGALALLGAAAMPGQALAGTIYLTGHDVDLHDGAEGYDTVILNYLRGAGTIDEIAAASYSIAFIGSGVGFFGWSDTDGLVKPGFESTTYYDTDTMTAADWTAALSRDALVIASHESCGGCDLSDAGVIAVNAQAALIATSFNAGMDIWGNSGASNGDYYDFLPPSATATGPPISGSSGFIATAAGIAIGLTPAMINGDPTHNRFVDFAAAFTVFETRPNAELPGGQEIISIGIRDALIIDDIIVDGDGDGDGDGTVPEPASIALLGVGLAAAAAARRRRKA